MNTASLLDRGSILMPMNAWAKSLAMSFSISFLSSELNLLKSTFGK